MSSLPVIVLGAGGHAKVVLSALQAAGAEVLGLTDPDPALHGTRVLGISVIGGDDAIAAYAPATAALVNGVGSTAVSGHRREIFERFAAAGFAFPAVLHPSAVVGPETDIGDGAQVMAGAVIQPGCRIGVNVIVNTGARIDHDCRVGNHAHVAPGAVLGGGVAIGDGCHIGAGATLIQNVAIGAGALVAAGATVVRDVAAGARVACVPARVMDAG